jgi:hypothetical protein
MCDTLWSGQTPEGSSYFAKNSDRHPEEPQTLRLVAVRPAAKTLSIDGALLEVPDSGHAFLFSKPSWMEGGEMGLNDRGVSIGNEAVFSRFKARKDGLLGMAALRAALSSASTAAEARDLLCRLVETREQGGNGAYKGNLVYHNSYLIADGGEAFVLETAARRWAWRRADGPATISNAYSITADPDAMDPLSAKELAALPEGRRSFRSLVEDRLYLAFTRGDRRRACTARSLAGSPSLAGMMAALRDHGDGRPGAAGMTAPCLHEAGFPVKSTSTASLVVHYLPKGRAASALAWFTGAPHPCLHPFIPVILAGGTFIPLWESYDLSGDSAPALAFWEECRRRDEALGGAARSADRDFLALRDGIQARLASAANSVAEAPGDARLLALARAEVGAAMADWTRWTPTS